MRKLFITLLAIGLVWIWVGCVTTPTIIFCSEIKACPQCPEKQATIRVPDPNSTKEWFVPLPPGLLDDPNNYYTDEEIKDLMDKGDIHPMDELNDSFNKEMPERPEYKDGV